MNTTDKKAIKTKEDVKHLFRKMIDDKNVWIECVRSGRSAAELRQRGIKIVKLNDVLS